MVGVQPSGIGVFVGNPWDLRPGLGVEPVAGQHGCRTDNVVIDENTCQQEICVGLGHRARREGWFTDQPGAVQLGLLDLAAVGRVRPVCRLVDGVGARRQSGQRLGVVLEVTGVLAEVEPEGVVRQRSIDQLGDEVVARHLAGECRTCPPQDLGPRAESRDRSLDGFGGGGKLVGGVEVPGQAVLGEPRRRHAGAGQATRPVTVVDGAVTGAHLQVGTVGDGLVQPSGGPRQGLAGGVASAQPGGQGRGQGAAGAVGVGGVDARAGHGDGVTVGSHPDVGSRCPVQVPGLDDDGRLGALGPVGGLGDGLGHIRGRLGADEDGEFGNVRGDDVGGGAVLAHGLFGLGGQQSVATGGHHDWVDDERGRAVLRQPAVDRLDDRHIGEHPGLDGIEVDVVGHGCELVAQKLHRRDVDAAHSRRVLGNQRGDHRHPVAARGGDRLHVGGSTGTAAGIGSRDRQHPRHAQLARVVMRFRAVIKPRIMIRPHAVIRTHVAIGLRAVVQVCRVIVV